MFLLKAVDCTEVYWTACVIYGGKSYQENKVSSILTPDSIVCSYMKITPDSHQYNICINRLVLSIKLFYNLFYPFLKLLQVNIILRCYYIT